MEEKSKRDWICAFRTSLKFSIGSLKFILEVNFMNSPKILFYVTLSLILIFFVPCQGGAQALFPYEGEGGVKPGTHAPVITHSFAVERGHYGSIWKIYLEAEDPDEDMLRIASVVDQAGVGRYPADWIYLRKEYGNRLKGYIQWNTFSSRSSYLREWTQITLKVSVFDKAGNESNVIVFPFIFELGRGQYESTPPWPFDQSDLPRLGYIHIHLADPHEEDDRFPIHDFRRPMQREWLPPKK